MQGEFLELSYCQRTIVISFNPNVVSPVAVKVYDDWTPMLTKFHDGIIGSDNHSRGIAKTDALGHDRYGIVSIRYGVISVRNGVRGLFIVFPVVDRVWVFFARADNGNGQKQQCAKDKNMIFHNILIFKLFNYKFLSLARNGNEIHSRRQGCYINLLGLSGDVARKDGLSHQVSDAVDLGL